jgi:glycerol-3-phosphate dehydrogenase (NAD(P)+)
MQHPKHKHNPNYLSSVEFDTKKLKLTSDIKARPMLIILYSAYTICLLNDESKPTLQRKNEEI